MLWKSVTKASKVMAAFTSVIVGLWACAYEKNRPLVTDATTNVRLTEIYSPADGDLFILVKEGDMFLSGDQLALVTAVETALQRLSDGENIDFDINDALPNAPYSFGIPYESLTNESVPVNIADLRSYYRALENVASNVIPSFATETALLAETSGKMWNWRRTSGATFRAGEGAGYVAECKNLIAIGQMSSEQIAEVRIGDPIVFVTQEADWTGVVQQVVSGVPNLMGQFAIQFPFVAPDSVMIFFALDVPVETQATCAVGVSGQIRYPLSSPLSLSEVGYQLLENASANLSRVKEFYQRSTQYVQSIVRPQ